MFNPDNKVFHILCYFWTNNQKYEIGEKNKKHVATSLLVMASYLVGFNQKSKENSGHVTKQNVLAFEIGKNWQQNKKTSSPGWFLFSWRQNKLIGFGPYQFIKIANYS